MILVWGVTIIPENLCCDLRRVSVCVVQISCYWMLIGSVIVWWIWQ